MNPKVIKINMVDALQNTGMNKKKSNKKNVGDMNRI